MRKNNLNKLHILRDKTLSSWGGHKRNVIFVEMKKTGKKAYIFSKGWIFDKKIYDSWMDDLTEIEYYYGTDTTTLCII